MDNAEIAIIGGSGFLGTRLYSRLKAAKVESRVFDLGAPNASSNFSHLDVEDIGCGSHLKNVEAIINLAAVHRDDIRPLSRYDDVNVKGSENVCEAARKQDIKKIIFTSSVAIYGFSPANTDESGEPKYFVMMPSSRITSSFELSSE